MYFFIFDAVPTSASPRAQDVGGGEITVFVDAPDGENAEVIARSHVLDYGWRIRQVLQARGPVPAQIPGLAPDAAALLRKAEREGVASLFVAWKKEPGDPDGPVEIRSIGPPAAGSGPKH